MDNFYAVLFLLTLLCVYVTWPVLFEVEGQDRPYSMGETLPLKFLQQINHSELLEKAISNS